MRTKRVATMISAADPWKPIEPPAHASDVSGRRVDVKLPWEIFWAVDADRNSLLVLNHDPVNKPQGKLPNLKGLVVAWQIRPDGKQAALIVRLLDNAQREIFHQLCLDIVSATRVAKTEEEAIDRFLARTWRWHRLLRGGGDGRLSDQEQKGLLGEFMVLSRILIPTVGAKDSVTSWTGPINAPKDFELGRLCIEAKAHRGAATPYVAISTEHQLELDGIDDLFLHVAEVTSAVESDSKSETVTSFAEKVRNEIESQDQSAVEIFEERLSAAGFDWTDDYSDSFWSIGPVHIFEVRDQFPRIAGSMLRAGVSNVRYSISLLECAPYRVEHEYLTAVISGGRNTA